MRYHYTLTERLNKKSEKQVLVEQLEFFYIMVGVGISIVTLGKY